LDRCRTLLLRARVAFASRRRSDALPLLLDAARHAEAADPELAREAYLEAIHAALHTGRFDPSATVQVSEAALARPRPSAPAGPADLLLDGLAMRMTRGYAAAAPILKQALEAFRRDTDPAPHDTHWTLLACRVASDLWDHETELELSARALERARKA